MSLTKGKSIVFHSTKSDKEISEVIYSGKFEAGKGGGAMLGAGFYANLHLYQAQKNNYGPNILKCEVLNIESFLFLDIESYREVFGTSDLTEQLNRIRPKKSSVRTGFNRETNKNIKILELYRKWKSEDNYNLGKLRYFFGNISLGSYTSQFALDIIQEFSVKTLKETFPGIVYKGMYDGKSLVCWYPNELIVPLELSRDNGKTWIDTRDYIKGDYGSSVKGSLTDTFMSFKKEIETSSDKKSSLEEIRDKISHSSLSEVKRSKMLKVVEFLEDFYSI